MRGGAVCLQTPALEVTLKAPANIEKNGHNRKICIAKPKNAGDGLWHGQEKAIFVMPRHIRLAKACYAMTSDAGSETWAFENRGATYGNKRARSSNCDFWARVDAGEIKIHATVEEWCRLAEMAPVAKVDTKIPNYDISTTSLADYSYKSTPFGDVYYSPRFDDNKYTYRFVILTKGVKNEAYRILKSCGRHFLSESQIIHQLGIDLSPGWEHFMVFRNKLDELILRRPLGS
ncbi:cyclin-dependent kinase regulatory subunit protein [Babesia caballi]|uniref:Cyclin-dependent kinases regulatory subunit n=1 Tax=Babesia caballi TaxID=5871 RepID=A0AAV4LWH3_BABCB|nr:cyclin-dependent kinase regulatory subunit protein [Babesia caballi]